MSVELEQYYTRTLQEALVRGGTYSAVVLLLAYSYICYVSIYTYLRFLVSKIRQGTNTGTGMDALFVYRTEHRS